MTVHQRHVGRPVNACVRFASRCSPTWSPMLWRFSFRLCVCRLKRVPTLATLSTALVTAARSGKHPRLCFDDGEVWVVAASSEEAVELLMQVCMLHSSSRVCVFQSVSACVQYNLPCRTLFAHLRHPFRLLLALLCTYLLARLRDRRCLASLRAPARERRCPRTSCKTKTS